MMKHRHLVIGSVLILTLGLGGCNWDSSLYDTYVHDDSVTRCPPGVLLTDDNGEKYIDLNTIKCYKDEIIFKSGGGKLENEPNCRSKDNAEIDCFKSQQDYRICMNFRDLMNKDTDSIWSTGSMPSIAFIQDSWNDTSSLNDSSPNYLEDYPEASEYRICPSAYNICIYNQTDFGCVHKCTVGCYLLGCMNSVNMCGQYCVDCNKEGNENTYLMRCNAHGECTAQECQPGYHLKKGEKDDQYECEENGDKACGAVDSVETSDCSTFDAKAAEYRCHDNGYCTVTKCEVGYHLKKGEKEDQYACEKNEPTLCGAVDSVETSDCSTFDAKAAEYRCHNNGYCTVTKCQSGYHLKKGEKDDQYECEENGDEACGAVDSVETSDCSEHAAEYRCHENGYCTVTKCQSGYHLKKGEEDDQYECEKNGDEACGAVDAEAVSCSKFDAKAAEYHCHENGYCTVTKCQSGYHLKKDEGYHLKKDEKDDQYVCEENTAESCGAVDSYVTYNCTIEREGLTGECNQNGLCACIGDGLPTCEGDGSFQSGECYHPVAGNNQPYCVKKVWCGNGLNKIACHDLKGWWEGSCGTQLQCEATKCQEGYELNDGTCDNTEEEVP